LKISLVFSTGEAGPLEIFFLNCDRPRIINDTLGHVAGDAVLIPSRSDCASARCSPDSAAPNCRPSIIAARRDREIVPLSVSALTTFLPSAS